MSAVHGPRAGGIARDCVEGAAIALDNGLFAKQGFGIVEAWRAARGPVVGRAVALTDEMIDRAMTCMLAFLPLTEEQAAPIFPCMAAGFPNGWATG